MTDKAPMTQKGLNLNKRKIKYTPWVLIIHENQNLSFENLSCAKISTDKVHKIPICTYFDTKFVRRSWTKYKEIHGQLTISYFTVKTLGIFSLNIRLLTNFFQDCTRTHNSRHWIQTPKYFASRNRSYYPKLNINIKKD